MTIDSTATGSSGVEPNGRAYRLREACAPAPSTCPATPGTTRRGCRGTSPSTSGPPPWPTRPAPTRSADVVRAAAAAGLRVAPQGTGHNAGPLGSLDDVVLLRTSAMTGVDVDPERRIARVEAGVLWLDVVEAAAAHGLAALHGSSPDVGVVGYSLGGGIGWYARRARDGHQQRHRPSTWCSATARQLRADADTEPGPVLGGPRRRRQLRHRHRDGVPALRHRDGVRRDAGVGPGARRAGAAHLGRLDRGRPGLRDHVVPDAEPAPDARAPAVPARAPAGGDRRRGARRRRAGRRDPRRPARPGARDGHLRPGARRGLVRLHMDPEGPTPAVSASTILADLPGRRRSRRSWRSTGRGSGSTLLSAELRQLGGALARPAEGAGALPMLEGAFVLFGVAIAVTPEMGGAGPRRRDGPGRRDGVVLLGTGLPELRGGRRSTWAVVPGGRAGSVSRASGRRVDPAGLLKANHPVPRLYENGLPTPVGNLLQMRRNPPPGALR